MKNFGIIFIILAVFTLSTCIIAIVENTLGTFAARLSSSMLSILIGVVLIVISINKK